MLFHLGFNETDQSIKLGFKVDGAFELGFHDFQTILAGDFYEGAYFVTPSVNAQTMETAKKIMKENVEIAAIPYYDVGNNSGGSTVYIGTVEELVTM